MLEVEEAMQENIDRGVAYLEHNYPGWFNSIDLDSLELSSCTTCVVGQLTNKDYELYLAGLSDNGWITWRRRLRMLGVARWEDACGLGFSLADEAPDNTWVDLTAMWKTTIEKLRAEAGTVSTETTDATT